MSDAHFDFTGTSVLITGGGTGIGKQVALDFAAAGANVALVARRQEPLEAVVQEIEAAGGQALYRLLDIRDAEKIEAVVDDVWEALGGIDVLVNNAGGNFMAPAMAISPNGWRTIIDINLNGTFFMSQAFARKAAGSGQPGCIVNMSATNAVNGSPLISHSGASKAGINSMTETLAVEWGPLGIRVNAILPGPVRTEGSDERLWTDPDLVEKLEGQIPLGRFARPKDISPMVLFLASPQASLITGALIAVDGGDRLRTPFGL